MVLTPETVGISKLEKVEEIKPDLEDSTDGEAKA